MNRENPAARGMHDDDDASEVRLVEAWHEALNAGDAERLSELSHPDVEVGGPRGSGRGTQLLGEWVARANIRLVPRRVFHRAGVVVAEQQAEWRDAETGEATGSQSVGTVFTVRDGRIASVVRYPGLGEALSAAGLDGSHEEKKGRPDARAEADAEL